MKNTLIKLENNYIDNEKLLQASNSLSKHMKNKFFFNPEPYFIYKGVLFHESYRTKNLRQLFFDNCIFEGADYYQAGLAGSTFVQCTFKPCDFNDTNFQSCDYRKCAFDDIDFFYTRFNKSTFSGVIFRNCHFVSVSFNDVVFDKCKFIDCTWHPISIENAIFRNTLLENIEIKNMNFEFVTFDNIHINNVKLPFPTIPFIFNGLTYIAKTKDKVRITSAEKPEGLSAKQYLENIPNLITFYQGTFNYFPLVNIYIMLKKYEDALKSIYLGVDISIRVRKFRMLRFFCRQLDYIDNVGRKERKELYDFILMRLSQEKFNAVENDSLNMYLSEVRQLLISENQQKSVQLILQTNILNNEFSKLSTFLSVLDKVLDKHCTYTVQLRHDSPFLAFVDFITNAENINMILDGVMIVLGFLQLGQGIKERKAKSKTKKESSLPEVTSLNETLINNDIKIENLTIINNGKITIKNNRSRKK